VTQDDLLYRFRLRVFAVAAELGNVRAACRAMGIHPSTYYRWKRQLERHGPEILRPRERRTPRMANQTSPLTEQRVVAFALGHPGFGPARIAAELAQPRWGGIMLSTGVDPLWWTPRRWGRPVPGEESMCHALVRRTRRSSVLKRSGWSALAAS
jgi:hypothetical protein